MKSRSVIGVVVLLAAGVAGAETVQPATPDTVDGLVAWYRVDDPHLQLNDRGALTHWVDASGNGRELTSDREGGLTARLRTLQLNDKPAVELQKGVGFDVASPFELDEHTIFVVYRTGSTQRVLFRSDEEKTRGVVLGEGSKLHVYRNGGVGTRAVPYTKPIEFRREFTITVLGRETDAFRGFINGVDVSSWTRWSGPIRVGKFFHLTYSQQVDRDAGGLHVAEMVFFDRFLEEDERRAVTAYLSEKYAIKLEDPASIPLAERLETLSAAADVTLARLRPSPVDANRSEGVTLAWSRQERMDDAFRHDPQQAASRVHATADVTAGVSLSIVLESAVPEVEVRLLVLKNGEEYLSQDGATGRFGAAGTKSRAKAEIETDVALAAGDYLEIVAFGTGAAGDVRIVADESLLVLQAR